MAGGRNKAKTAELIQRRRDAIELRKTGASYIRIAQALAEKYQNPKYGRQHAFKDVDAALAELVAETRQDTEALRQLELERLDQWMLSIAKDLQQGDLKAIETALKISAHRAKLLGLEAPVQIKIQEGVENELSRFLESLQLVLDADTFAKILQAFNTLESRKREAATN